MEPRSNSPRDPLLIVGAFLFATAFVAFAVQNLFVTQTVLGLEPLPKPLPGRNVWALCNSLLLLGAGASIILRWHIRIAAITVGLLLLLWLVLLHGPILFATPRNGGYWTVAFETLALSSAAWVLAASGFSSPRSGVANDLTEWGAKLGRFGYALSLPAFGVLHLLYPGYVAAALPGWLPWHYFWTYFVAGAFFVAGASLASGIKARLAAILTGVMFLTWVLILHFPRAIGKPQSPAEWTSLLVALAMGSGAWILTSRFARHSPSLIFDPNSS